MSGGQRAKDFWDARAGEDALYFVDNRSRYGDPDEEWFWTEGANDLETVLDCVGAALRPEDDVVDIGCGVGRLTRAIAARSRTVRALDVSPRMLDLARRYNPTLANVEWIEGDGTSLSPLADECADACVSHVVFQHIPDPAITLAYVREIGRVLRPGGWTAFQISNTAAVHGRPPLSEQLRGLLGRSARGLNHPNWRGSPVELPALRRAANDGGMRIATVVGEGTQFCMIGARKL